MELTVISPKFCCREKEERFGLGKTFPGGLLIRGTTCVSLRKNTPTSNNSSVSQMPAKSENKVRDASQNTEISSFQTASMLRPICCIANSVGIVSKCAKTTSAHVKNKENTMLCTLSTCKIHIKGKKRQ